MAKLENITMRDLRTLDELLDNYFYMQHVKYRDLDVGDVDGKDWRDWYEELRQAILDDDKAKFDEAAKNMDHLHDLTWKDEYGED